MAFKIFSTGTVIDSAWLNDVNQAVYVAVPGKVSSINPTLVNPILGNATATTVNKITFTQPATGATLTIPNGATAVISGTNTGDQDLTNYAQYNGANTWSGYNNFSAGLGTTALTVTTINKVTITAPASSATLTIPNGATATVSGVNTGDQDLSGYGQKGGNNTWTGTNTFNSASFSSLAASVSDTAIMYNAVASNQNVSGAVQLGCASYSTHAITVVGNAVISFSGTPPVNRDQTVYIVITNGGAFSTTFAAGTKFPGGTAPTFTASGTDLLSAWYNPAMAAWVVGVIWKDIK